MKIKMLNTSKYCLNFNVKKKCVKMIILWTISKSYEVLSFIPPCWESWLGVSPFGILTKQALKWDVKTLGSGCMSLGWNLTFTGFVTFLNLGFLICTVGMKELLHRVGVRMREDGVQDQGQRLVYHSALRTRRGCGSRLSTIPRLNLPVVYSLHCCHSDPVNIEVTAHHFSAQNLQWLPSHLEQKPRSSQQPQDPIGSTSLFVTVSALLPHFTSFQPHPSPGCPPKHVSHIPASGPLHGLCRLLECSSPRYPCGFLCCPLQVVTQMSPFPWGLACSFFQFIFVYGIYHPLVYHAILFTYFLWLLFSLQYGSYKRILVRGSCKRM